MHRVAVLGCGVQGRHQLAALLHVRRPQEIIAYSRRQESAEKYAAEMRAAHGLPVRVAADAEAAVRGADLVITCTPARAPVVRSDWIAPGTHVTAVGADMPDKLELEPALLGRATVVADRLSQCVTQGEIHHAIAAGVMRREDVHAELGEVLDGRKSGRTRSDEITVADLTGIGALDAAVANLVTARAVATGAGRML